MLKLFANQKMEKRKIQYKNSKVFLNNNKDNKKYANKKITDEKLLEKTGGIIQGMSVTNNSKWKIYRSSYTCTCE